MENLGTWIRDRPILEHVTANTELAQDLYPIFLAMVDWCRKAGKTETNSVHAAVAALRAIGVWPDVTDLIRRRYAAGTRATAELDYEGVL